MVCRVCRVRGSDTREKHHGPRSFSDLEAGQRVEVEFRYRDERHCATEIELED